MPSRRHALGALALLVTIVLSIPAAALAQSAGNQQYIDPLAGQTQPTTTSQPAASAPSASQSAPAGSSSSSSAPATGTSAASSQATTSTTEASASTQATDPSSQSSARTLPFTGLDLVPCLIVACVLLGAGVVLRRATQRI